MASFIIFLPPCLKDVLGLKIKKTVGSLTHGLFFITPIKKPRAYGSKPTVFLFYNIMLVSVDSPPNGR